MQKIVLASSSPRRKELLEKFNLKIDIIKSNIEEKISTSDTPIDIAMGLAFQKAFDVTNKLVDEKIVIGADTIVVYDDVVLGKPTNRSEAFDMINMLSGKTHSVITGICIMKSNTNIKVIDYVETKVRFRNLTNEKINNYLNTDEYKDKAGAYGIQGFGSVLVDSFKGSYTNVVGLPISKLDQLLENYFDIKLI